LRRFSHVGFFARTGRQPPSLEPRLDAGGRPRPLSSFRRCAVADRRADLAPAGAGKSRTVAGTRLELARLGISHPGPHFRPGLLQIHRAGFLLARETLPGTERCAANFAPPPFESPPPAAQRRRSAALPGGAHSRPPSHAGAASL